MDAATQVRQVPGIERLRWFGRWARRILLWHPLGHPLPAEKGKLARLRMIVWEVLYRLGILPILVLLMLAFMVFEVSNPARAEFQEYPEDYGLTCRSVSILGPQDCILRGWYINSLVSRDVLEDEKWKELRPAVLLLHDYGAARDQLLGVAGERLVRAGYDVLLIDLPGHGQSDDRAVTFGADEALAVRAAVDWLSMQPGVDSDRIGLMGQGMGAYAAMQAAPDCPQVRCVVAAEAYPSVPRALQRSAVRAGVPASLGTAMAWGMGLFWNRDVVDTEAADAVGYFGDRGLLLVTGAEDTDTPAGDLEPIISASRDRAARFIVPNAAHGKSLLASQSMEVVLHYLDNYLGKEKKEGATVTYKPQKYLRP